MNKGLVNIRILMKVLKIMVIEIEGSKVLVGVFVVMVFKMDILRDFF